VAEDIEGIKRLGPVNVAQSIMRWIISTVAAQHPNSPGKPSDMFGLTTLTNLSTTNCTTTCGRDVRVKCRPLPSCWKEEGDDGRNRGCWLGECTRSTVNCSIA
jgi:hypothetical protein